MSQPDSRAVVGGFERGGTRAALFYSLALLLATLFLVVDSPGNASAYTPHAPIYIDGNGGFTAANGVTAGSGTPADPYIIEGWDVVDSGSVSIEVRNTDAHFVIRGVYLHGYVETPLHPIVLLANVANGVVYNASLSWAYMIGIQVVQSSNVNVSSNRLSSFGGLLVLVVDSTNVTVSSNVLDTRISNWPMSNLDGVRVSGSRNITIASNDITLADLDGYGFVCTSIALQSSTSVLVDGNNLFGVSCGPGAIDDMGGENRWDNGYPSGGNYWSDYGGIDDCSGPNQDVCPDPDGIGDTPHVIDADSADGYPLMAPRASLPGIFIISPMEGEAYAGSPVVVRGVALDASGAGLDRVDVRVNGGPWQTAAGTSSWNASVDLLIGSNVIDAQSWDNTGNASAIESLNVIFDQTGPTVAIISPLDGAVASSPILVVSGTASDSGGSGLERVDVRVNGGPWQTATGTSSWSSSQVLVVGVNRIEAWAWDKAANPSAVASVSVTYVPPPSVPGPPMGLTSRAGDAQVTLRWSPPTDEGTSPITNYRIYRGTMTGGGTFLIEVGDVTTYVDSGLTNGQTYFYTVTARSTVGEGPASEEASAMPRAFPPPARPGGDAVLWLFPLMTVLAVLVTRFFEFLRIAFLTPFVILWARLNRQAILDHEKRGKVQGYLAANPGANFAAIRADLRMAVGTLAYHLYVLETEGILRSWRDGRFRRYAPSDHRIADLKPKLADRLTDIELILLEKIAESPSASQRELSKAVGVSQPAIHYHITKMAEVGAIRRERRGLRTVYSATLDSSRVRQERDAADRRT